MKRLLASLPLVGVLLILTGCGSQDARDLDPVASAATLTSDAGSARIAFETAMKMQGRNVKLVGEGRFDFEDSRGVLTMDVSSLLPGGSGDGRFEMRMLGSMIYMRTPAALGGQGLPGGKRWVAFDVEKTLEAAGLGSLDPTNLQQDPTQILRLLRASATSVQKAGTAEVRGVATTRYDAKLDLKKAIESSADKLGLSEKERTQLRRAARQLSTQSGVKTLPVEVFVDQEGLLRRMRVKMKTATGAASFSLTQTTDYYDFGVDVDVDAPPDSQVIDLSHHAEP